MDIISMQIANRLQKKINTEYGGMYEIFTATEGQTAFTTKQSFMKSGHTLKVFIDGALAVDDKDYSKQDSNSIVFSEGLQGGNIVLIATEVVGVPKFENPIYDDANIKNSISLLSTEITNAREDKSTLLDRLNGIVSSIPAYYDDSDIKKQIQGIIATLDDNKDGSITDTIGNLKAQWDAADEDLKKLVDNKVEKAEVDELSSSIDGIKISVASKVEQSSFDGISSSVTSVVNQLTEARGTITSLSDKINAITDSNSKTYDDSVLKSEVSELSEEITTARSGSTSLSERLNSITSLIPTSYDDSALKSEAATLSEEIATARDGSASLNERINTITSSIPKAYDDSDLKNRVTNLESKKLDGFLINDTVTGTPYKLTVSNGILSIVQIS